MNDLTSTTVCRWSRLQILISVVALIVTLSLVPGPASGDDKERKETKAERTFRDHSIVRQKQCITCHTIGNEGGTVGPILNQVGNRRSADWLRTWLSNPNSLKPGTKMPTFEFSDRELDDLVAALSQLRVKIAPEKIMGAKGSEESKGEQLFAEYDCAACHRVGGEGRFVGPDLTWIGHRKGEEWEATWLRDPPAYKPGTFMPDFNLSESEISALTTYLHSLQGQENKRSRRWEQTTAYYLDLKPVAQGELTYRRLACWACHGEKGKGGVRNDNAAPDGLTPAIDTAIPKLDDDALAQLIRDGRAVSKLDPGASEPFGCPPYAEAVSEKELGDLIAYLRKFAPKKSKWSF